ncbi:metalloregulator ArsR/SmtB family transcription factor [Paenarthrobacter sp. NPDC089322]|uniref:ArsR/SmtB family transcription factor n=1 Tax=Paenarthrobacter sp. NPDC089322 TaxID=3155065 RepID=UPI003427B746
MVTDDVFAVIAEATRRDILVSLRSGDKAVGELVEELAASQPTISKHLKVLREADLVSMRAQGQKRFYALNPKPLAGVANWLETFDVGPSSAAAVVPDAGGLAAAASTEATAAVPSVNESSTASVVTPGALSPAVRAQAGESPVSLELQSDDTVPQQIGRTVGRAATKAADLLANLPNLPNLPKFGRKR